MDLVTIGPFNDGKMAASEFRNKILQLFRLSAAARGRHGGTPDTSFNVAPVSSTFLKAKGHSLPLECKCVIV